MNKFTLSLFLFVPFLLISCVNNETPKRVTTVPANSINGHVVTEIPKKVAPASGMTEAMKEKKRQDIALKSLTPEALTLITELTTAQKSKDRKTQEEVMKKIRTFEVAKKKELDALVKAGDTKKAQELRKSLQMFHMAQSNVR